MVEIVEDRRRWEEATMHELLELGTIAEDGYQRGEARYTYAADRRTMRDPTTRSWPSACSWPRRSR